MHRPRTALVIAALAFTFLGACGGRSATQSSVQDKVEDLLTNEDDVSEDLLYPGAPLDAADAAGAAACVAQGLFDPNNFSKDERNDVTQSIDADLPSQGVIDKFQDLVDECVADATAVPTQGPSAGGDDEDTTTTERQSSSNDD